MTGFDDPWRREAAKSRSMAEAGAEQRWNQSRMGLLWILSEPVGAGQLAAEAVSVASLSVTRWHSLKVGLPQSRRRQNRLKIPARPRRAQPDFTESDGSNVIALS